MLIQASEKKWIWWKKRVEACKFNKKKKHEKLKMDKSQKEIKKKVEDWFRIQENHEREEILND